MSEHDHDHDHKHGHHHDHDDPFHARPDAPLNYEELDPASRSLADALRLSFGVLKFAMVLFVVYFLASGAFEVSEGQVGVRMHLGSLVPEVYKPGMHPAWPEPIDRVIRVSTGPQRVTINDAFWFNEGEGRSLDQIRPQSSLRPGQHGSLVTGDKNIVHGRFTVTYAIREDDAVQFVANVTAQSDVRAQREAAARLVQAAAERAIVHVVAQITADEFVRSGPDLDRIRFLIQERLDQLGAGIEVARVESTDRTPPLIVREAFQLVSSAESERAQKIDNARRHASRVLNSTAGQVHAELLAAIEAYETARLADDDDAAAEADRQIAALLERGTGEVSRMIQDAHTFRRELVSAVQAEANLFQQLLPRFNENPRIVTQRLWQDVRQEVLAGDVETFYFPSDPNKHLYVDINRDPRIQRDRERERLRRDIESNEQAQREAYIESQRSGR